jgi:hypothetical protein
VPLVALASGLVSGVSIGRSSLNEAVAKVDAQIDTYERLADVNSLRNITLGGTVNVPPWGGVNFSDGKPERVDQKARAQAALNRVLAHQAPPPSSVAPEAAAPDSVVQRAINAALNAGNLELAAQLGRDADTARTEAQRNAAGGLLKSLSPTQMIAIVVVLFGIVILVLRRK